MSIPTHDTIVLETADARVELVPALGGKITALTLRGREWLWTSDVLPRIAPTPTVAANDDVSYVLTADTGGYDECVPTVGACTLPDAAADYRGLRLPDHGELWSQRGETEVEPARGAMPPSATTRWIGRRMPYAFTRTVSIERDGAVRMQYAMTNTGLVRLPFVWSAHPLFPLTPDTRIELPIAARVRVDAQHGIDLGGRGATHRWPMLRVGGREVDFTQPAQLAHGTAAGGYACKLFLDLAPGTTPTRRLAMEQGGARLSVEVDAREVPTFGLWLNNGGWTPFERGTPYHNFAFEPCLGAPDSLADALGAWDGAQWLEPGATRRWALTWR